MSRKGTDGSRQGCNGITYSYFNTNDINKWTHSQVVKCGLFFATSAVLQLFKTVYSIFFFLKLNKSIFPILLYQFDHNVRQIVCYIVAECDQVRNTKSISKNQNELLVPQWLPVYLGRSLDIRALFSLEMVMYTHRAVALPVHYQRRRDPRVFCSPRITL
jgi:hypothetical protein